jgi:hypothetical protein
MMSDWIVVVEAQPREQAERAFSAWLKEQADQGKSFRDDEIRQDVILSKDRQQLVRYAVQSRK